MVLVFPLFCIGISIYSSNRQPLLSVALYNGGNTSLASETISILTSQTDSIHFYEVSSEKQLRQDVAASRAECGYLFTGQYSTENILEERSMKDSVCVFKAPNSILSGSINELVFSAHFQSYCRELLLNYVQKPGIMAKGQELSKALTLAQEQYQLRCQDNSTFSIEITNPDRVDAQLAANRIQDVKAASLTGICRGILSVWMMLAALSGGCQLLSDQKSSLFAPLSPALLHPVRLLEILLPTFCIAVSGLIGLALLPSHHNLAMEGIALLLYLFALSIAVYGLTRLPAASAFLPVLMPFLLLGALIFAPVFLDLSAYIKVLSVPKYLFLNTYYLKWL